MIFIEFLRFHAKKVVVVSILGKQSVQPLIFNMKVGVFVALIILPATLYIVICSLAKNKYSKKEYLQIFNLY